MKRLADSVRNLIKQQRVQQLDLDFLMSNLIREKRSPERGCPFEGSGNSSTCRRKGGDQETCICTRITDSK